MTDLISRADALEQMAQAECGLHYDDCEADNCSCSYIQRILDIPSADAVEVVRCKDCKYGETSEVNKYYIECKLDEKPTFVDGFCSYGKRKTQPIPMFKESEEAYKAWTGEEMGGTKPMTDRPHGEWINQDNGAFYPYECSNCHEQPFCDDYGYHLTNYCPNCGAKMGGDGE